MSDTVLLLYGTVLLRPYVFAFLIVYLAASCTQLGWKRTLVYLPLGYALAFLSEFSSINWGFPYGDYFYIPATIDKELWVFGVPFMDSLSYVFLSYCSYSMAVFLLSPVALMPRGIFVLETRRVRQSWQTLTLGAFLFVLLDLIIDPVALQGHRWFLGQIYGYREAGTYFGVPMSNFGGWLLVGYVMVGALQLLDYSSALETKPSPSGFAQLPGRSLLGPALYISILIFNLTITFWIGENLMGVVGCLVLFFPSLFAFFFTLYKNAHVTREHVEAHLADFPWSGAAALLAPPMPEAAHRHHAA
jgi:uncharacterized membrane protein